VASTTNAVEIKRSASFTSPGVDDELLNVGDFRINLNTRTVLLRGSTILLTAEEFDLLVFLVTNPKKLVTPQTMLSTLWQGSKVHQTQFLAVLLSLRKKLDAAGGGTHYLKTEPMVVYRFDPKG